MRRIFSAPRFFRNLAARDWSLFAFAMLALAALLSWPNGLGRLDRSLYDLFLVSNSTPAREDIIVVAIDDYSLSQLGRWPWPRTMHAQLIDRLAGADTLAVGLDVIFAEPDGMAPQTAVSGDDALAAAVARHGKVVMPVISGSTGAGLTARLPIAPLARNAAALGHINLHADDDGIVRRVYLQEGMHGEAWPHFARAVASVGSGQPQAAADLPRKIATAADTATGTMLRDHAFPIPFAGGIGHFRSVPYASVVRGEVPPSFFKGKYVLVGATAPGLADAYPTPASGENGVMPGIDIHANVLASLLDGRAITLAQTWQTTLFSLVPVLLALTAYLWLSPRAALVLNGGLIVATLGISWLALQNGFWLPPMAAVIVLIMSYPLWSWRRLEAAIRYLDQELARLATEPHLLPETAAAPVPAAPFEDLLEQRMNMVANAARRLRDMRQFIADSLDSLPDATLVTAADGHVLLANRHATEYFATIGIHQVHDALLPYLFASLQFPKPVVVQDGVEFEWWNLTDTAHADMLTSGISVVDPNYRNLLIKSAPCHTADGSLSGWIVNVADVTTLHEAENNHEAMVRFLSHDMRSPLASILALLELQSDASSALPQEELLEQIDQSCRKALSLTENIVTLSRAESQDYRLEDIDFQELLDDVIDEMWSVAKSKHIYLVSEIARGSFPVRVDRTLMKRALNNLVSNAVHYSAPGTRISCILKDNDDLYRPKIVCSIKDQGIGIAPDNMERLFKRFQRFEPAGPGRYEGGGLGLLLVKTVVERHHGKVSVESELGAGSTFTITIPKS